MGSETRVELRCRRSYSWIRPPRRALRTIRPAGTGAGGLAAAARRHRRRLGRRWYIDGVFLFRGSVKRYLYRAVDEYGRVVDVLLRERRDLASAQAFFRRARATAETQPTAIVTDHHQPYVRAARQNLPGSLHIRTGLHRLTGETTKPIERSHIATRDRLRASRGLKTTATGQRFLEGFEAVQALRRGMSLSGVWCLATDPSW
ncbi:MAG TPA: DDE-type integrase/transposase/recombinase, partial [Candidatus Dormibacteraeota bacterium]|nr:DDE-type integrase/transposase/recombinase [Candidatus Dormibacteraeota bacterium]